MIEDEDENLVRHVIDGAHGAESSGMDSRQRGPTIPGHPPSDFDVVKPELHAARAKNGRGEEEDGVFETGGTSFQVLHSLGFAGGSESTLA